MYKITSEGAVVGYSDTAVYIKLHENGCYIPCEKEEAEGFCVKTAIDFTDEETSEEMTRLEDFVYRLTEDGLNGVEPMGELEDVSGTLMLAESDKVLDILLGGVAE